MRRSLTHFLLLATCAVASALAGSTPPEPYPFAAGEDISLRVTDGPVTLRSIRFEGTESKLKASVLAFCDEGKDRIVELEVMLLDGDGRTVGVLTGKGTVEEEDKAKIKVGGSVPAEARASIARFEVALFSRPD